jgi:hypothetical protein
LTPTCSLHRHYRRYQLLHDCISRHPLRHTGTQSCRTGAGRVPLQLPSTHEYQTIPPSLKVRESFTLWGLQSSQHRKLEPSREHPTRPMQRHLLRHAYMRWSGVHRGKLRQL